MEYKEIKRKKDGATIVFCNFEELLKEAFGADSMKEVEEHLEKNGKGYMIHCPFCREEGHTKHKLSIKADLTVGNCYVCGRIWSNVSSDLNITYDIPEFVDYKGPDEFNVVKLSDPRWSLEKFNTEFTDFNEKGYEYLVSRHKYMAQLYKILKFKFMGSNIAIPFYYKDEFFYYQIRFSFTDKTGIRYYFPPISAKPPYIIEHGSNNKIIICEGVFDAIALLIQAPEYTPFAVLGSSISDYQICFLREYVPEKILIYMDETSISTKIANKLRSVVDYCPIDVIKSDGEDPEECMKRRMNESQPLQWIK